MSRLFAVGRAQSLSALVKLQVTEAAVLGVLGRSRKVYSLGVWAFGRGAAGPGFGYRELLRGFLFAQIKATKINLFLFGRG